MSNHFLAGVSREIITPPLNTLLYGYPRIRHAESVHDDLCVTAFSFKSDSTEAIMLSVDLCALEHSEVNVIRKNISLATGVPENNITISVTHTHSGPSTRMSAGWGTKNMEYIENILFPAAVKAASSAHANMREAVMGIGSTESVVGINRRERRLDGTIALGQNPWGVFNKEMLVFSFADTQGNIIGNMIHYNAHGTAAGASNIITRDWPGVMCDVFESEVGGIAAFFPGPSGDTGPRVKNGQTTGTIDDVEQLGTIAGNDALKAYKNIKEYSTPNLVLHYGTVSLPFKSLTPYKEAKAKLEALGDVDSLGGVNLKSALKYKQVMEVYEKDLPKESALEYSETVISLGDTAFVTFPFEVFSEIALRIKNHSPFTHTVILNNTNGIFSYFPTKEDLVLGGYEVAMFGYFHTYNLSDDSDTIAVNENIRLLNELKTL